MSQSPLQLPDFQVNPWGIFLLIELCFVMALYQTFGHLPWNMGTMGLLMFTILSLGNLLAMLTVMSEDNERSDTVEEIEQFDDWGIDIDWDDVEIEDKN